MRQFYIKHKKPRYSINYFDYIKSKLWQDRKERYFRNHERICDACGSKENIDLHHTKYENFGREPNHILISFCRNCHEEFHKTYLSCRDMRDKTKIFIDYKHKLLRK
jgi:hypothetical protein